MKRRGFIGGLLAMVGLGGKAVQATEPTNDFTMDRWASEFKRRVGPGVRVYSSPPQHFINRDGTEFLRSGWLGDDGEYVWFRKDADKWVKV